jgi:ABC-type Na+ efflux pump permease subunit
VILPGASELVVGNVGSGVAHFAATTLLVAALAPAAPLLAIAAAIGIRANSYKRATTGVSLFRAAKDAIRRDPAPAVA